MLPTLVLVHGAWMSPASWQPWIDRYSARGYRVVAPSWPHDEREVAALVASPDPALAEVGVTEIVDHYQAEIGKIDGPVVLIGHSFGGLFVQMLLDRGVGVAGVAIDPAPPKGVFPSASALKAGLPALFAGPIATLSFGDFQWGWMHTQPEAEQRAAYDAYVVPTPRKVYRQGAFAPFTDVLRVDFARRTQPLLLVAGLEDRTVSASMVRAAYKLQRDSKAITALHEFPGRTHWIVGQPGWEEVADDAIGWVETTLDVHPAAGK